MRRGIIWQGVISRPNRRNALGGFYKKLSGSFFFIIQNKYDICLFVLDILLLHCSYMQNTSAITSFWPLYYFFSFLIKKYVLIFF